MKEWKAVAYLRLSRDDDNYGLNSLSINNQKDLIIDWLESHPEIILVDTYIDDGYTGTNFDRPGFKNMMFDINCGLVNCVIVKDLSRLGRNTSKVGQLKDEIFPSKGIRFIAINDNVDTQGGIDDNDVTDFKLVCNEYYVKDISKKTKTALRTRAKRGDFIGAYAPYGYKKSKNDYHKLEIDIEASIIVCRIFEEYVNGKSGREIAENLNKEGVLSPMNYRLKNEGRELKNYCWSSNTIYQIINNDVYFGDMVQHKRENISYKLKQRRVTAPEERIVVQNTHEAIIDESTKNIIIKKKEQNIITRNRKRKDGSKMDIIFSGLLVCADCNNKLAATIKNNKRCYRCCRYNNSGNSSCSSHLIYENVLIDYIKNDINHLIDCYEHSKENFINKIFENISSAQKAESKQAKIKLSQINSQISQLENAIVQTYNDKHSNIITPKMFSIISKKYNEELEALLQEQKECDIIINRNNINKAYIIDWINSLIKLKNCKILQKKQLETVIDTIYIGAVHTPDRIKIKYKIGFLCDKPKEFLKSA